MTRSEESKNFFKNRVIRVFDEKGIENNMSELHRKLIVNAFRTNTYIKYKDNPYKTECVKINDDLTAVLDVSDNLDGELLIKVVKYIKKGWLLTILLI